MATPAHPLPVVELTTLTEADLPLLFSLWSDADAVRFTNWPQVSSLEDCEAQLERVLTFYGKSPLHFGPLVIRLSSGELAGIIGADVVDEAAGEYDAWYFLRRDQWGKRIAKSALVSLLDRMAASKRVRRVTATAVVENEASWGLLESVGFRRIGRLAEGHQRHGLVRDLFEYALALEPPGPG